MRSLLIPGLVMLVGCSKEAPVESVGGPDFSTPEAAAKTCFKACADKDADLLSKCFSKDCEREFKALVDRKADARMLGELCEMFSKASVTEAKVSEDGKTAVVKVKLEWSGRKSESLEMSREGEDWKIRGF